MTPSAQDLDAIILAAGSFPRRNGPAWRLLSNARRVIACDSAGAAFRHRFHRWPDLTIGDMDSFRGGGHVLAVEEQETNDLAKAIRYCRACGWNRLAIVGATGLREDHTIGNIFRALDEQIPVVTDAGVFTPVFGRKTFRTEKDIGVSIFAPDSSTKMTSRGLKWSLDGVRFTNAYCATLNRTTGRTFTVVSDRPVFVFVAASR